MIEKYVVASVQDGIVCLSDECGEKEYIPEKDFLFPVRDGNALIKIDGEFLRDEASERTARARVAGKRKKLLMKFQRR